MNQQRLLKIVLRLQTMKNQKPFLFVKTPARHRDSRRCQNNAVKITIESKKKSLITKPVLPEKKMV
jgi:hypothetical protein